MPPQSDRDFTAKIDWFLEARLRMRKMRLLTGGGLLRAVMPFVQLEIRGLITALNLPEGLAKGALKWSIRL